ncbi:hypothetical protein GF324_09280, partial [bacterium]|nr:hypothetical protein [bacterium]
SALIDQIEYDPDTATLWFGAVWAGVGRVDVEALLPLMEVKPGASTTDTLIRAPIVYPGWTHFVNPHETVQNDRYTIEDLSARTRRLQDAIEIYSPVDFHRKWPFEGFQILGRDSLLVWSTGHVYNLFRGRFHDIEIPPEIAGIVHVRRNDNGTLAICSGQGLFLLGEDSETHIHANNGLPSDKVLSYLQDRTGISWMIDQNGRLCKLVGTDLKVYDTQHYSALRNLTDYEALADGSLSLLGSHGLVKVHPSGRAETVADLSNLYGRALNIRRDRNGNYLLLTTTRAYIMDASTYRTRPITDAKEPHTGTRHIEKDEKGNLWFTLTGDLYRWDGSRLTYESEGLELYSALFLDYDRDDRLMVGQWFLMHELTPDMRRRYYHDAIEEWPGRQRNGTGGNDREAFRRVDFQPDLMIDRFAGIGGARGPDGAYWVGTFAAGLVRFQPVDNAEETVQSIEVYDTRNLLTDNSFEELKEGSDGTLYFVQQRSVVAVRKDTVEVIHPSIPENAVLTSFLEDLKGRRYSATTEGLFVSTPDGGRYGFDRHVGLQENALQDLVELSDGRLLCMQDNSCFVFHPDRFFDPLIPFSEDILVSVQVDSTQEDPTQPVKIRTQRRAFHAKAALTDYFNEGMNQFSWRLQGFEAEYRPWSRRAEIDYTSLRPGEYKLDIRGQTGRGNLVEEEAAVTLVVPPRLYETVWFRLLMGALLLTATAWFVYWRVRTAQERKRRLMQHEMDKLRVATTLAATIAHEFNNPLAIMKGQIELEEMGLVRDEKRRDHRRRLNMQIDRMAELVQKLLRINELKERDYAGGMSIIDLHTPQEDGVENESAQSGETKKQSSA